jgi:L-iditol 2-dehydrogenase
MANAMTTSVTTGILSLADALQSQGSSTMTGSYANPSLQVTADQKIKIVEAPVEEPGPGEVLLHIKATGVCG